MNAPNRPTHHIQGVGEVRVLYGDHDLVEFVDSEREPIVVEDATEWIAEQRPKTDAGSSPFDGTCPMCGASYESYTYHLRDCEP